MKEQTTSRLYSNNLISFTILCKLEGKKIGNVMAISFLEAVVNCMKYYI